MLNVLLANVRLAWPYKERWAPKGRQRRQWQIVQQNCGIGSKLLKLVKKVAKAPITKNWQNGIKWTSEFIWKRDKQIKNLAN